MNGNGKLYSPRDSDVPDTRRILGLSVGLFTAAVAGIAVIIGLCVAGYQLNWFVTQKNLDHQVVIQKKKSQIVQNNYGTQEGYINAITNDISQIDGLVVGHPGINQQAIAVGNQACQEATLLTGSVQYPPGMKSWISTNCQAGAVSPTSPLRKGTGN